jgi:hypothetical protein
MTVDWMEYLMVVMLVERLAGHLVMQMVASLVGSWAAMTVDWMEYLMDVMLVERSAECWAGLTVQSRSKI